MRIRNIESKNAGVGKKEPGNVDQGLSSPTGLVLRLGVVAFYMLDF